MQFTIQKYLKLMFVKKVGITNFQIIGLFTR